MKKIIVAVVLVAVGLGCKKDKGAAAGGGEGVPSLDSVAAQAHERMQALGTPDVEATWSPGALREDVVVEALGITLDHPENVTMTVAGKTATVTGDGFYPVTITVEKLTLENAPLKVEVDGVPQLGRGTTWDGNTQYLQTDCDLVRCSIEKPDGWYVAEIADAGTAICRSIEAAPPPMAPGLDRITSSNSTGGQCPEGTMERGQAFLDAAKAGELSAAFEACWVQAVVANEAWKGGEPTADIRLSGRGETFTREIEIRDLEGDTASFRDCLTAAAAPLDAQMPTEALPEGCVLTSVAYVRFGEKVACP